MVQHIRKSGNVFNWYIKDNKGDIVTKGNGLSIFKKSIIMWLKL